MKTPSFFEQDQIYTFHVVRKCLDGQSFKIVLESDDETLRNQCRTENLILLGSIRGYQQSWNHQQFQECGLLSFRFRKRTGKKCYFDPWDWTDETFFEPFDDLERKRQEDLTLEKKSSLFVTRNGILDPKGQVRHLCQVVQGLANSSGGYLYIGVPDGENLPVKGVAGDLRHLESRIVPDWLDGFSYGGNINDYDAYVRLFQDSIRHFLGPVASGLVTPVWQRASNQAVVLRCRVRPCRDEQPVLFEGSKLYKREGSETVVCRDEERKGFLKGWASHVASLPPAERDDDDRLYLTVWSNGDISFKERRPPNTYAVVRVDLPDRDEEKDPLVLVYRDAHIRFLDTGAIISGMRSSEKNRNGVWQGLLDDAERICFASVFPENANLFVQTLWQGDIAGFKWFDPQELMSARNETSSGPVSKALSFLDPDGLSIQSVKVVLNGNGMSEFVEKDSWFPFNGKYRSKAEASDFGKVLSENNRAVSSQDYQRLIRRFRMQNVGETDSLATENAVSLPISKRELCIWSDVMMIRESSEEQLGRKPLMKFPIPESLTGEAFVLFVGEQEGFFAMKLAELDQYFLAHPNCEILQPFCDSGILLKKVMFYEASDILATYSKTVSLRDDEMEIDENGCPVKQEEEERFKFSLFKVGNLPIIKPKSLDRESREDDDLGSAVELSFIPCCSESNEFGKGGIRKTYLKYCGRIPDEPSPRAWCAKQIPDDVRCPFPKFDHRDWVNSALWEFGPVDLFNPQQATGYSCDRFETVSLGNAESSVKTGCR